MKVFFIVLICSVINLAQMQNTYVGPDNSLHYLFNKSLQYFDSISQTPSTYFSYIIRNNFIEADSVHQRMDSLISNSITGGKLKMEFEYDSNDNIIEQLLFSSGVESNWVPSGKTEYYFAGNQNLICELHFDWNGSSWDSVSRFEYYYNIQGQLTQFVDQNYIANNWENYQRESYKYDVYGNAISQLMEEWQNGWQNFHLFTAYFSNVNRMDSSLFQMWDSTYWENYARASFYYNNQNGFLESFIGQLWAGGSWINNLNRKINNDDNGNQLEQLDLVWNGNDWENSIRRFFTYDGLNYTLTAYCELWNGTEWYMDDGEFIIENPDGFRAGFLMHNAFIYYKTTGIDDEKVILTENYILYQNYPNPFNSTTKIKYKIPVSGKVTLKIFDLIGSEVATVVNDYQTTGSYEVSFQAENLSSGIYIFQLQAGKFRETKKLILLK